MIIKILIGCLLIEAVIVNVKLFLSKKLIDTMASELFEFTRQALFWNFISNELIRDAYDCESDHLPIEKYVEYADTEVEKVFTGHPDNIVAESLRYYEDNDGTFNEDLY